MRLSLGKKYQITSTLFARKKQLYLSGIGIKIVEESSKEMIDELYGEIADNDDDVFEPDDVHGDASSR